MADIYQFPRASGIRGSGIADVTRAVDCTSPARSGKVPETVWRAVETVRAMPRLAGVRYREIPVPTALCDYGIGVELSCDRHESSGWVMVLFDCEPRREWHGHWRCVAFASMPMDAGEIDALTTHMTWDDVHETLVGIGVRPDDIGGTITMTRNTSFGTLEGESVSCEMRVSWTPATMGDRDVDAGRQINAWGRAMLDMRAS
ncbi:DUF3000 family protein [Bifidobacterium sp. UBA744]|uniref:DUF3000 family protein n=1 Tax=Bifidobacterium sp. UBA744 TaxID=1946112 RepID=UPI0025BC29D4|nr:DUF3000 family protein [Bifidobacterium sp. UBA744]